jgi:hypothetical protein
MLLLDKEEDLGMMGIFLVCRTIGMASSMTILQARRRFGWWQFARASCSSSSWKDDGGGGENAYTILGLQRSCSVESIRAAFRDLAKATHPDLQPNCADDDDSRRSSAQQFVRVLAAYQASIFILTPLFPRGIASRSREAEGGSEIHSGFCLLDSGRSTKACSL